MPAERTTMRQVREVLRLKFAGVPTREIARRIGVAASIARATIDRFRAAGLSWPLPDEMTDAALEAQLYTHVGTKQGHRRHVEPDWATIHRELKLFADLALARGDGRYPRLLRALGGVQLLILDLCAARSYVESRVGGSG